MKLLDPIVRLGQKLIDTVYDFGEFGVFMARSMAWIFRRPFRVTNYLMAMEFVGVGSLFIVLLTGLFAGAVMALQGLYAFGMFDAEALVGGAVAITLSRELSPVLTALMVAGRVASAMATEIGTMRVTEQVDALEAMAVNPIQYLVTPRVVAGVLMVPILTLFFTIVGMVGAYFVAVTMYGSDPGLFLSTIEDWLGYTDLTASMYKGMVFGFTVTLLGCYKGYKAAGGARGVGLATTQAVVLSSVLILMEDYFLTIMLF